MTSYVVSSGQTSSGVTLNPTDTQTVLASGTASATVVNALGTARISGGTLAGATVNSGGVADVYAGGVAVATTVTKHQVLALI